MNHPLLQLKKTSKKKPVVDDEPTPIGRVQAIPSVAEDTRPKVKEDISKLFVMDDDDDEKEAKRGTPAAARKQKDVLLDAKDKLKARLKDDPKPKGKKEYTVTVNPDGSQKTEQDILAQKQKEAEDRERRGKKKADKDARAEKRRILQNKKDDEAQRKAKLTGSAAKLKNKKKKTKMKNQKKNILAAKKNKCH